MRFSGLFFICTLIFLTVSAANAQKSHTAQGTPPAKLSAAPEAKALGFVYKGIGIGMTADEVRAKLGEPKDKSDPQDMFVFGDDESAQFIYGADKKVKAIMITFSGKIDRAPTAKDVFGEDVPARPDGGISKMVRNEKAGYWISYNKIVGDDSMVNIAMQKIP